MAGQESGDRPTDAPTPLDTDRFFDLSIDMLCFARFTGFFVRLNPAWQRTLGWSIAELTSRPMIEFVHPDDRERTIDQNRRVRAGEEAVGFENRYRCKDGTYRWFLWNATADLEHEVIYSVARDITRRKQAEADRDAALQELQVAMAEVRSLQEILPICSYCKRIRDDADYWQTVESYLHRHTNSMLSHGICPDCYQSEIVPQL